MKHLFCFLLLFAYAFGMEAAEYRNNQLYLEINLAINGKINLKQQVSGANLLISDAEELFCRTLKGNISISPANPGTTSYYTFLEHREVAGVVPDDTLAVAREFFAWEDNHLVIKHELLFYSRLSFASRDEAESYAKAHKIDKARIIEVPLINSTVKVQTDKGESIYWETPLRINCSTGLKINEQDYPFEGEFILKTVSGKLVLNQVLGLEDYLAGVIQNEIGNTSPHEALKAQAVAARTHALSLLLNNRHKADGYDLCSGTHCQVYKGKHLQSDAIRKAVLDCRAEALFTENGVADATYHSSCGGKTDASSIIWKGKPIAHLNGVTCIPEADSLDLSTEAGSREWIDHKQDSAGISSWERGAISWEKSISRGKLAANLGMAYIDKLEILSRGHSGRIVSMKLYGDKTVKLDNEYKIRQAFGNLLSSFFYIKGSYNLADGAVIIRPQDTLNLKGKGAGHGVGMCQVGALRMARAGINYLDILAHYYPGVELRSDWLAWGETDFIPDAE